MCPEVDLQQRTIVINPPEGLLDLVSKKPMGKVNWVNLCPWDLSTLDGPAKMSMASVQAGKVTSLYPPTRAADENTEACNLTWPKKCSECSTQKIWTGKKRKQIMFVAVWSLTEKHEGLNLESHVYLNALPVVASSQRCSHSSPVSDAHRLAQLELHSTSYVNSKIKVAVCTRTDKEQKETAQARSSCVHRKGSLAHKLARASPKMLSCVMQPFTSHAFFFCCK
eukprot:1146314-Pelagomonas_calceolata.AAC.2